MNSCAMGRYALVTMCVGGGQGIAASKGQSVISLDALDHFFYWTFVPEKKKV
jgi:hypothetical protein